MEAGTCNITTWPAQGNTCHSGGQLQLTTALGLFTALTDGQHVAHQLYGTFDRGLSG